MLITWTKDRPLPSGQFIPWIFSSLPLPPHDVQGVAFFMAQARFYLPKIGSCQAKAPLAMWPPSQV